MTVERIPIDLENNREAWLALRRQDVTASDIAVVVGASPYKSAMRLWAEKTGDIGEQEDNAAMRRGRWLEQAVLRACRDETDWLQITQPNVYLRDPEKRIGATPDAIATDAEGELLIQCKVIARPVYERDWAVEAPLHYQLQTLTEAMLWGAPRAFLAVLVIDTFSAELKVHPVPRHPEAEAKLVEAVARFWAEIEAGKEPSADYSRDGEVIRKLFGPKDGIEPLDLTGDNLMTSILEERAGLKSVVKNAEERLEELDAEIIHKLNGATSAICDGWKISHSMTHRNAYTVPEKSYPVLRVNQRKST